MMVWGLRTIDFLLLKEELLVTKETVNEIIQGMHNERPKMLRGFGDMFFFQYINKPFSD